MIKENNYILSLILFILIIISIAAFSYFPLSFTFKKYFPPVCLFIITTVISFVTMNKVNTYSIFNFEEQSMSFSITYIINILYIFLFTYSLVLIILSYNQRPLLYFLLIALIVGILTFEILYLPAGRKYILLMLAKIGLIAINLRLGIQYIFSHSFIWYDPYYHKQIIEFVSLNGYVPQGLAYSSIPIFHILFTCESVISGINDFIYLFCINFILKSFLMIIFLYLIGWKFLRSKKVGLLSSLLYAVLDRNIIYDISFSPTSLAILLSIIIIYLIFNTECAKNDRIILTTIVLLLMLTLILTHTLTSVLLSILLIVICLSSNISKKLSKKEHRSYMNLSILFPTAVLAYWTYATGYFITQLANIFKWGFKVDDISPYMSFETTENTLSQIPLSEHILSYFGFYLFASLSILGCVYSFSNKNRNNLYLVFFSISSIFIFMITFVGIVQKTYVVPDRWWYYSEHIGPIMVFGLISFVYGITTNSKKIGELLIIILFIFITFFNITDPIANIDAPLFSENLTVRHACLSSEVQSIGTISHVYDGKILTDVQSGCSISVDNPDDSIEYITEQTVHSKRYTVFDGLIILRKYILDFNPFDAMGLYKLDDDLVANLENRKYNEIYNSKVVYAYIK